MLSMFSGAVLAESDLSVQPDAFATVSPYFPIETPHITLQFPAALEPHLATEQIAFGNVFTQAFYMKIGESEIPLYRLDFGDKEAGDWVGLLKTDQGDLPITSTVFTVTEEELIALDAGAKVIYAELMDAFSVMLKGIYEDSRFMQAKPAEVGEIQLAQLAYWSFNLTENISWLETTENGNYQATFYGSVQGESIPLYTVRIGDILAESVLGSYEIDGVRKSVSVESFPLTPLETWSDEDLMSAGEMMSTINDLIKAIMNSEAYSSVI